MIAYNLNKDNIEFFNEVRGEKIPFECWKSSDDVISYLPLKELADNGFAALTEFSCKVPYMHLYFMELSDMKVLDIPTFLPYKIRLKTKDTLDSESFAYKLTILDNDGSFLKFKRTSNIMESCSSDEKFLLSFDQYKLFEKVEEYNNLPTSQRTRTNNLKYFSEIKELALNSNCKVDNYITEENVYTPEKIKLSVGTDNNGFSIQPQLEHEDNDQFQKAFDTLSTSREIYPVQGANGRTIFLFNEEQKEGLTEIKKHSATKSRDEIRKIISKPTEFFNPDIFNLDEFFSERVIEYGLYKPRFYPFVSPYKSCWIAGATIEDDVNGTSKISFETEEDLAEFEEALNKATSEDKSIFEYKGAEIDVDDAKALVELAHRQFESPEIPVEECAGRKVLIIKENAEDLEFTMASDVPDKVDNYVLHPNVYLNPKYELKPHQEWGIAWLQYMYSNWASGCLMADDMGLGKTLQILYFIDWLSRNNPEHNPYLIVAPVSLLENWKEEYDKFIIEPKMRVTVVSGHDIPRQFDRKAIDYLQHLDIVLTNYETMRNAQLNFCAVDFDVVILDEAQRIKTPGTLVTNAAKALKANFRIALTGTPVENSLLDLWCIFDFCAPGLLGNAREFAAKYQRPLKRQNVDLEALGQEIRLRIGQYMIRRMKADVAKDLPEKIEVQKKRYMPAEQQKSYSGVLKNYQDGDIIMLEAIMHMREVSEHPYLYTHTLDQHDNEEIIDTSARLISTIEVLDEIKQNDEKAIIFAERKDIQRMLQRIVRDRYGIYSSIINGDTPTTNRTNYVYNERYTDEDRAVKLSRQRTIDAYQRKLGFNVIIMSPVAAGMGLNVTAANHVIHYSRHWNPAKENQATDRAYRIGQTKNVYVYYPMAISKTDNSFDETLDLLLSRKSSLASSTIFPTEQMEVTKEELYEKLLKA